MKGAEKIVTRLPCGGRIVLRFYAMPSSPDVDKVAVVCLPEVYCAKGYAQVKRCAWFDRIREFYARTRTQDVRCADRDGNAGVVEAEVVYCDRKIRHVRYGENSGIVICGTDIFQDGELRIVPFKERKGVFEKCVNVKTWHGRIIAFFKRIFGRRKGR